MTPLTPHSSVHRKTLRLQFWTTCDWNNMHSHILDATITLDVRPFTQGAALIRSVWTRRTTKRWSLSAGFVCFSITLHQRCFCLRSWFWFRPYIEWHTSSVVTFITLVKLWSFLSSVVQSVVNIQSGSNHENQVIRLIGDKGGESEPKLEGNRLVSGMSECGKRKQLGELKLVGCVRLGIRVFIY